MEENLLKLGRMPVFSNAVFNTVGIRITNLPITSEKVLRGLKIL